MSTYMTGDIVAASARGHPVEGIYITDRDGMAVLKLKSGYNIGVDHETCTLVRRAGDQPAPAVPTVTQDENLPELAIISTGGTIASKIDYRTGAVTSQFTADDILRAVPGLTTVARYRAEVLATILSENMTPSTWQALARAAHAAVSDGAKGVIVTHGTDTLAYSASALSFMLDTPAPVVFVGSQRSADRPSSDNVMNAMCAAAAARSDLGEVAVAMHATTDDDLCAVHRGTRVRKMHTSRRDAFQSHEMAPVATVAYPSLKVDLSPEAVRRGETEPALHADLEERCGLLYFYPGMPEEAVRVYEDFKGLVIAGTGLGHVSSGCIGALREMVDAGTTVVMTSQCLHGRVCDRVYDTGRDLLAAGVVEGEDMLPETALTKLMWVLGNVDDTEEARRLMATDLKGEIKRRSDYGL
ncbi:Glu-tRNA(Gln) amidotransferase subunit GatD [Methanofollis formosanus]|uniref:Glutamyl-tRNA(Gln) amidotransferase subunit D n=1 Tax=Methanofollis formosanus TaxID=299308 RepID=A0A8G1A3W3_9EURY|nr:Glu-tRNA(Gln) amidotransferase subunit GatD [Methanofollis formosanus]QYZ80110.1 Glu-tRNA(Gln) amidotransferase subunit GatD [Methanofollis formosanus]